ncbi:glycosyltransferase [Polaromonas sp.]|uniref:glycosyltransferase n=1 Tax=Polaromonas sp. TaxID=1869339 RepID=UPI003566E6FA
MIQDVSPTPAFAVCLAAFNGVRWLPEQLDSILAQQHVDVRVFVSVDASSDGTEDWMDQAAMREPRITVLPHGSHFGGAAPNFFRLLRDVDVSGFDYVALADQDDIWFVDKLIRAHQEILRSESDAYSSNVLAFWPSGRRVLIRKAQPQVRWDFLFEAAGPGCTYVIRTGLVQAVQALLHARSEEVQGLGLHDWFLYAFARAKGYRWVIDERAGMLYRQHRHNQVGVNAGWRASIHRVEKVLGGWALGQSVLTARLTGLSEDPFVNRWSDGRVMGLLWLALHAGQCRRRPRDRMIFALSCVALCFVGNRRR